MPTIGQPDDWPFETLKLGEYFAFARAAAENIREQQVEFSTAVNTVLAGRVVTGRERRLLEQKAQSIVYLGEDIA